MGNPKPREKKPKSRRQLGSRSYKNYSKEILQIAVESVQNKTISSRDAEKQFGIPRRTILNKINKQHCKTVGTPTKLKEEEEKKLVKVLIASANYGHPLTKLELRIVVHDYLVKNGKDDLFNKKIPGEKWVNSFLLRHANELTTRVTQNISSSRAEKGEEEILVYFNNLRKTLEGVPPQNILNYDETNCSDDPGTSKAIFRRGVKYPERIVNSTKGCISLMFSGTADGQCLPPYIVYKAKNLYNEWVINGPDRARYNCTTSGWFDAVIFEDFFRTVILKWAVDLPGTKVMIGDNLSSHLNSDIIELCEEHQIKFVFLPPNSTHLTQPLDVAFFGPLKKQWRKILLQYKIQNPHQKTMNKKHFPTLLNELMEKIDIRKSQNLKSGFRATGIYPLEPRQVLKRIPEYEYNNLTDYEIDKSLLHYLKMSRAPNPMKTARCKKIYIEPGKSVSSCDLKKSVLKSNKQTTEDCSDFLSLDVTKVVDAQDKEKESQIDILDEKTGFLQTTIITTASIETPNSIFFTKNENKENMTINVDNYDTGNCKNKIENTAIQKSRLQIKKKRQNKTNKYQRKKKRNNINYSSSTTSEEIVFSIHSDSDLDGISFYSENNIDDEDDETVKREIDERESKIFDEIRQLDETTNTEQDLNKKKKKDENKNNIITLKNDSENKIEILDLHIDDTVLARYYSRKNWKYYIGVITEIKRENVNKYGLSFYKTIRRQKELKFVKPKRPDVDYLPKSSIVKKIDLMQISEFPQEFVLFNDEDSVLFYT